ncbi:MAG: hypothetical protein ACXVIJ_03485 [Thermoanaerobaculia bacterium]
MNSTVLASSLLIASLVATGSYAAEPPVVRCTAQLDEAQTLVVAGKKDQASKALNLAIERCTPPASADEKKSLAVAHIKLGTLLFDDSTAQALTHFRKGMELDPDNVNGSIDTGAALVRLGAYKEAISILEAAIKRGTTDKTANFWLEYNAGFAYTNLCVKVGVDNCDPARGEQHYMRAALLNPEHANTYFQLAAFANEFHRDSLHAMQLFKKSCDLGEQAGCVQYNAFKAQFDALEKKH